jgi:hypothetical protein
MTDNTFNGKVFQVRHGLFRYWWTYHWSCGETCGGGHYFPTRDGAERALRVLQQSFTQKKFGRRG